MGFLRLLGPLGFGVPLGGRPGWASPALTLLALQGRLISVPGTGPVLRAHDKDTPLAGKTPWLFHTLEDPRLMNHEVRLEGARRPDGTLEVERLLTLHNGKPYRVRYYCEICNIEALEPGKCVCCQQPTEMQEIPVGESDTNSKDVIRTP